MLFCCSNRSVFSREAKEAEAVVADSLSEDVSEAVSEEMLSVSLLFAVSEVEPAEEQPASRETVRVQMQRRDKSTLFFIKTLLVS